MECPTRVDSKLLNQVQPLTVALGTTSAQNKTQNFYYPGNKIIKCKNLFLRKETFEKLTYHLQAILNTASLVAQSLSERVASMLWCVGAI